MSSSTALRPAVRAAFSHLVDYAGLFPPAQLSMEAAAAQYARARCEGAAWMLGRFIVPVSRIEELIAALPPAAEPFGLSAIVDAVPDARRWFAAAQQSLDAIAAVRERRPEVRIEALEVPLPPPLSRRESFEAPVAQLGALLDRAGVRDLPVFAEAPRDERWEELMDSTMAALARARLFAKVRCGGTQAQAYPSSEQLARFVASAHAHGVAFKATAGLHHPVRHMNEAAGVPMHGFVNLLCAAAFAPDADEAMLANILSEQDAAAFAFADESIAWRGLQADVGRLERTRAQAFVGYGSCSFDEPVDDLVALGILDRA